MTQITSVSLCPMTWPGYEGCTAVTFGVSLVYEDEDADPKLNEKDLKDMWVTYVNRDPFALRLAALGIKVSLFIFVVEVDLYQEWRGD